MTKPKPPVKKAGGRRAAPDAIDSIKAIVYEVIPDYPAEAWERFETWARKEYGGQTVYFSKAPARAKAERLGELLAGGMPIAEAFREMGVSRSYGYRLLKRPNKQK